MEWKTVKLGEVCKIFGRIGFRGYTNNDFVTKPEDGAITLSPTNIVDGELDLTKCAYINWNKYYESPEIMVQENDILLSKTGTIGRTALVKRVEHPMTINPQFVLLKECTINPRYLSYLLKSSKFQGDLYSITVGSVIATLSQKNLGNIKIDIVDSASQDKIVSILSSLDDKIENNNRINRNLEEQAQALFKSWFVDFEPWGGVMPEEWKEGVIADLTNLLNGFAFKSSDFVENGQYKLITIKGVQDGKMTIDGADCLDMLPNKMPQWCQLQKGDILLSLTGNVGRCCLVDMDNCLLNQRVAKLQPKAEYNRLFVYSLFRQESMKARMIGISRGTAQMNLSPVETGKLSIIIPSEEVLQKFGERYNSIIATLLNNIEESARLAALRDTLLPKLMKGEIEVA